MTNEEKLKQLLTIAVENGWKNIWNDFHYSEIEIQYNCSVAFLSYGDVFQLSLNDLVTNFEEGEISFIDAIAFGMKYDLLEDDPFDRTEPQQIPSYWFRDMWNHHPTSERLNWLFNTFKHLLDEK